MILWPVENTIATLENHTKLKTNFASTFLAIRKHLFYCYYTENL
jgi:hypothetical protein